MSDTFEVILQMLGVIFAVIIIMVFLAWVFPTGKGDTYIKDNQVCYHDKVKSFSFERDEYCWKVGEQTK